MIEINSFPTLQRRTAADGNPFPRLSLVIRLGSRCRAGFPFRVKGGHRRKMERGLIETTGYPPFQVPW